MIRCKRKTIKRSLQIVFILTIAAFGLLGLTTDTIAARKIVKVDGSSTVFPITEAVAEEFQAESRGKIMITIGISGTGGGFKKFCIGETDISDASRKIKAKEATLCKANGIDPIELPIAYDGLAVMVNPANDWVASMTVGELKKLWEPAAQGKVKKWSQLREGWPDKEIHLYGPGVDSGTFDYFTKAIVGKEGASRGDFTVSVDPNVLVHGISRDRFALGFFGLAYYAHNKDKLKLIGIDDGKDDNGKGPILPSVTTVNDGTYRPLSRPIFIYVSKQSAARVEVDKFVRFYLDNAAFLSKDVGYIDMPKKLYDKTLEKYEKNK